jgi:hypothetical protein
MGHLGGGEKSRFWEISKKANFLKKSERKRVLRLQIELILEGRGNLEL